MIVSTVRRADPGGTLCVKAEENINDRKSYPLSISVSDFIDLQRIAKRPPLAFPGGPVRVRERDRWVGMGVAGRRA